MSILIMAEMFKTPFGSSSRKMVAVRLADFADDDGRGIWPSVETIASQCEISPRTVQRILSEFVEEGLLVCKQKGGGRRTSRYDFDLGKVRKLKPGAAETPENDEGCHGVTPEMSGDTDDTRGDTVSPLGCHGDGGTVIEPSIEPSRERDAQAREPISGEDEKVGRATIPGTADFEKRVARICNGEGFSAGEWPKWASGASFGWIKSKFAKLEESERQQAERWRDAYLRDMAVKREKPVAIGNWFDGRYWDKLNPAILERAERAAEQGNKPSELAKPDGWAKGFGPVWAAALFEVLLGGVQYPEHKPQILGKDGAVVWLVRDIQRAWPKLNGLKDMASIRGGLVLPERLHAVAGHMEFVPRDSAVWSDWMKALGDRGWPDVLPSGMDGGYFPVGGPAGLDAFAEELVARQGELKQSEGAQ